MKCKFCGEEMPERGNFCPMCGKDNSLEVEEELIIDPSVADESAAEQTCDEVAEDVAEQILPQAQKAKRTAIITGCIAALAVLALVLFLSLRGGLFQGNTDPTQSTQGTQGTQAPTGTIPADGNPDDATCKGSYTVEDQKAIELASQVVATVGNAQLTNAQLQIYYQMEIIEFLNQYGYYLSYFGLDYTQPLDVQQCPFMNGYTWQQYFLECALYSWQQAQALALEAQENNFLMDSQYQEQIDTADANMLASALQNGFTTADEFLQAQCGVNTTMADYKRYMEVYFNGYLYFSKLSSELEIPSDDVLTQYYEENKETLQEQGILQDGSYTVSVRHILMLVDGGVENADGTITFPDEAVAAEAYAQAQAVLDMWLADPTEENFAALAKEYTADVNGEQGGLYEGVYEGQMVATFNDWCFDETRQIGDYGIVTTRFGYHIMFFSGRGEETWLTNTRSAYMSQMETQLMDDMLEKHAFDVEYEKIALAFVSLV